LLTGIALPSKLVQDSKNWFQGEIFTGKHQNWLFGDVRRNGFPVVGWLVIFEFRYYVCKCVCAIYVFID
jgi:hypothetical protein